MLRLHVDAQIVGVLVLVEEETQVAPGTLQHRVGGGAHRLLGLVPPVRGDLRCGQGPLQAALGLGPKIAFLEVRVGAQEIAAVGPVALRAHLADVEVLAEVRGCGDELAAHHDVPHRRQRDHAEGTRQERTRTNGPRARRWMRRPVHRERSGAEDDQEQQVPATEDGEPQRDAGQQQAANGRAEVQNERGGPQDEGESRLLHGAVVVDRRDEYPDQQRRQIADGDGPRDPAAEERGQPARRDPQAALDDADQHEASTEDAIERGQEVGVERIDPEWTLAAQPLAMRNALCPLVVVRMIELELVHERRSAQVQDVGQPQDGRHDED